MIVTGMPKLTDELCKILNLDPKQVRQLNLEIYPGKFVLVTVTLYLGDLDDQLTEVLTEKKYEVKEI